MQMLLFISIFFNIAHLICGIPNFVIFLADDLGYGDLGCFKNDTIKTPNIDALARKGIKLNHHLTAAAVCTPSRAALLTGRYPIRSGMESSSKNKVFFFIASSGGLPENETTFAKSLKQKGYSTALIGKWHLGNDCEKSGDGCHHPLNHGFDYFYGLPLSNIKDLGDNGESVVTTYIPNFYSYIISIVICGISCAYFCSNYKLLAILLLIFLVLFPLMIMFFVLEIKIINGIIMRNKVVVEQPLILKGLTQRFVNEARLFLKQQVISKKPFLLFMSFVHVHTALFCSQEFSGKSKHGRYGDNVEELDWAVGEIMSMLDNLQISNNTFVYFTSDNGAHIEEVGKDGQREGGSNGILRGGKMMGGMEGGIRVPTIISWPNSKIPVGSESDVVTSQMDLFPTMMDLANIPLPQDRRIDGRSLIPILENFTNKNHHKFLFHYCGINIHAATYIPKPEDNVIWKLHWTTPKFLPGTSRCEYVCHCYGNFVEHYNPPLLYELSKDPSESYPIDINSDQKYQRIISEINDARFIHETNVDKVPDQFNFDNTMWKPWLQPCCNFPFCKCKDSIYDNI